MQNKRGFTVAELMLTIAIGSILMTLASVNLFGSKARASLNTTVDTLFSDFHLQQIKSMIGDSTLSSAPQSYGIHFNQNSYVVFQGTSYNPSDNQNFTVDLGDNIVFTQITFPDSQIAYATLSGELINFNPTSNSIILRDQITGKQKTIIINRFGVIHDIN